MSLTIITLDQSEFCKEFFVCNHPILYTVVISIIAVMVYFPYLTAVFLVNYYLKTLSLPFVDFLLEENGASGNG